MFLCAEEQSLTASLIAHNIVYLQDVDTYRSCSEGLLTGTRSNNGINVTLEVSERLLQSHLYEDAPCSSGYHKDVTFW